MARTAQMNVDKTNEFLAIFFNTRDPMGGKIYQSLMEDLDSDALRTCLIGLKFAMTEESINSKDLTIGLLLGVALCRGSNNPKLDEVIQHVSEMDKRVHGENVTSIFSAFKNKH